MAQAPDFGQAVLLAGLNRVLWDPNHPPTARSTGKTSTDRITKTHYKNHSENGQPTS